MKGPLWVHTALYFLGWICKGDLELSSEWWGNKRSSTINKLQTAGTLDTQHILVVYDENCLPNLGKKLTMLYKKG